MRQSHHLCSYTDVHSFYAKCGIKHSIRNALQLHLYGIWSQKVDNDDHRTKNIKVREHILSYNLQQRREGEWRWCAPRRGCEWAYFHVFFLGKWSSVWLTVHICKCISVYQSRSLSTPHTVSSFTGLPEAELSERISIWQEWILDCAPTNGWIRRDRASLQQDLRLRKCLRRGCSGKSGWVSELKWWSIILSITGKIFMMSLYEAINPQIYGINGINGVVAV